MDIDLKDSVIIFDESHNVESFSESSNSYKISKIELKLTS